MLKIMDSSKQGSKEYNVLTGINIDVMCRRDGYGIGLDADGDKYAEFRNKFRCKDNIIRVYPNGSVYRRPIDDEDGWVQSKVHMSKSGRYPELRIKGVGVKLYNLVHACFDKDFTSWFKVERHHVLNHTVLTHGANTLIPLSELSANYDYTEVVNLSMNNKHGAFMHHYDLADIYVSAFDVAELEGVFEDLAHKHGFKSADDLNNTVLCDAVVEFYKNKGCSDHSIPRVVDFRTH